MVLGGPGYLWWKDSTTAYWSILTGDCGLTLDDDKIRPVAGISYT